MAAFDSKEHYLDPATGFQRHKETHHLVGIEQAPTPKHPDEGSEFPKWVLPHASHVHRDGFGHVSTPGHAEHHVLRNGDVHVLVHDADEEAKALSAVGEDRETGHSLSPTE